jgi:hypothetical protein
MEFTFKKGKSMVNSSKTIGTGSRTDLIARSYYDPNLPKDSFFADQKILEVGYVDGTYWYKFLTMDGQERWVRGKVLQDNGTVSFDTGGYTGSWGPEGRIAMLHQKEIVLNAHDTENLLSAIEIVRSIADRLDANARITAQGLGNLATAAAVNNNREVLEQNVTIHAEFPNATDHNEIELAFGDLINQASQYINRR